MLTKRTETTTPGEINYSFYGPALPPHPPRNNVGKVRREISFFFTRRFNIENGGVGVKTHSIKTAVIYAPSGSFSQQLVD